VKARLPTHSCAHVCSIQSTQSSFPHDERGGGGFRGSGRTLSLPADSLLVVKVEIRGKESIFPSPLRPDVSVVRLKVYLRHFLSSISLPFLSHSGLHAEARRKSLRRALTFHLQYSMKLQTLPSSSSSPLIRRFSKCITRRAGARERRQVMRRDCALLALLSIAIPLKAREEHPLMWAWIFDHFHRCRHPKCVHGNPSFSPP